jgi:hypothetical protein
VKSKTVNKAKKKKTEARIEHVISSCDGYWEWFERSDTVVPYEINGKYLFFSPSRELLVEIAIGELENGGFHQAKTHMADITPPSGEYVLCLYYKDESRKYELAKKYKDRIGLNYRYWKSDDDTITGKYSKQFIDRLSPEDKKVFESKRTKQ